MGAAVPSCAWPAHASPARKRERSPYDSKACCRCPTQIPTEEHAGVPTSLKSSPYDPSVDLFWDFFSRFLLQGSFSALANIIIVLSALLGFSISWWMS